MESSSSATTVEPSTPEDDLDGDDEDGDEVDVDEEYGEQLPPELDRLVQDAMRQLRADDDNESKNSGSDTGTVKTEIETSYRSTVDLK